MATNGKNASNAAEIDRLALLLAKDPRSKSFLPLAEEYCKAGMWAEASVVLEDGLKHYPGFITAMVALGRAYDQLGQQAKARLILEDAVKLSPDNVRAHRMLIKIYMAQGLTDEARKACDMILSFHPGDEEARVVQTQLVDSASNTVELPKPELPEKAAETVQSDDGAMQICLALDGSIHEAASSDAVEKSALAAASSILNAALHASPQGSPEPEPAHVRNEEAGGLFSAAESSHAGTVRQLEAWLQSIQEKRLDRAA